MNNDNTQACARTYLYITKSQRRYQQQQLQLRLVCYPLCSLLRSSYASCGCRQESPIKHFGPFLKSRPNFWPIFRDTHFLHRGASLNIHCNITYRLEGEGLSLPDIVVLCCIYYKSSLDILCTGKVCVHRHCVPLLPPPSSSIHPVFLLSFVSAIALQSTR